MLYRKAYQKLLDWKESGAKQALCIVGARQIGKCILSTKIPQKERINSLFSAREFPYLKLELYC